MTQLRTPRGITLVETLVAGTIMVSMGLMAVMWLTGVSDLWWTSMTQSQVRATVQQAVSRMTSELRNATRNGSPTPPGLSIPPAPGNTSLTFYLPKDVDGDGTITDATGAIEWERDPANPALPCPVNCNPIQYTYDAPTQQLRRIQNAQTTILANGVTSVRFDDASTDATLFLNEVKITLTLRSQTPQGRTLSATSVEVVKLRN